jgi:hypothetical protein
MIAGRTSGEGNINRPILVATNLQVSTHFPNHPHPFPTRLEFIMSALSQDRGLRLLSLGRSTRIIDPAVTKLSHFRWRWNPRSFGACHTSRVDDQATDQATAHA